jgi:hypothetical protein
LSRVPKEEWTEWTKRIVETAANIDEGTFDYFQAMGDENEWM